MKKNLLMIFCTLSGLLHAMGTDVNYDEQMDSAEKRENTVTVDEPIITATPTPLAPTPKSISSSSLEGLALKSLSFQQRAVDNREKKYIEVTEVLVNSQVTYINKLINKDSKVKKNIVVKNPMPDGTKYVLGSASCLDSCRIRYSSDNGQTFVPTDKGGEAYNYIEFTYDSLPSNKEFRMGFDVIIK